MATKKRFAFVDGLSGMFLPKQRVATKAGETLLTDSNVNHVSTEIEKSIRILSEGSGKVILVVDQLDLLLAAGGDQISASGLGDMLLRLREV